MRDKLHWEQLQDKEKLTYIDSELAIVKCIVVCYNVSGQWRLRTGEESTLPSEFHCKCIIEKVINLEYEFYLVGARCLYGTMVFYPLTINMHEYGILRSSIVFPASYAILQKKADSMPCKNFAGTKLCRRDYDGVFYSRKKVTY